MHRDEANPVAAATPGLPARDSSRPVAVVGAGVIGAGWTARWRLRGVDVRCADPSPDAPRILDEVFALAAAAWEQLGLEPSTIGSLELHDSIEAACDGAAWVQESVPESLELKRSVLAQVAASVPDDAIIASSTSGFRCSVLADGNAAATRMIVAHPFNPVYLLPLVEVVGGAATDPAAIERARTELASIGMHPLVVRAEIDAHIADRLLEAVWREALWLVEDGIATTADIDDAIRYGFGLRWAQMGLFETYRIAGGEGGMSHFIAQFGPALQWPWSKLTDVPVLTDELVQRIADQSDAQSGDYSLRELEAIRDRNLVGILLALERNRWGAGASIAHLRASPLASPDIG